MRSVFPSADAKAFVIETYRADEGMVQMVSRLEAYLATEVAR